MSERDRALACIKGGKYVFVTDGKVYTIAILQLLGGTVWAATRSTEVDR